MEDRTKKDLKEEIRNTAELIFDVLYHHEGEMDIVELKEQVKRPEQLFDWGIGWLLGKDDIEVIGVNGSFSIRRTSPAPAVLPFRGN